MAAPVLALRNARLRDGARWLFDGVDIILEPRDRACLVGRNGEGKSTLLRVLTGAQEPDEGVRAVAPGVRIVHVAQEPPLVGETLLDFTVSGGAAAHEAGAWLDVFELDPRRSTLGLSGGETRRAALAKAFSEDPDVLLLDEPTNHLDIFAIARLEDLIARSRAAVLIVSHDRMFLERVTRRCFWLADRRVRRLDKGFAAFDAWAEGVRAEEAEVARRLEKSIEREQDWLAYGVTARRARNEGRRRNLMALRAQRAEMMRLARGQMSLDTTTGPLSGKLVIEARSIAKRYGTRTLLDGFSTRVRRGDKVAVVGPNGAGKTTLVKLLLGELAPDAGSVRQGANLEIAYVDQARVDLDADLTLRQFLAPLGGDHVSVRGQSRHVAAYAKEFLFGADQLNQPVRDLSGGERNRLLLARALAKPSNVLVLDEPTNDLDMETLDLLEDVLSDYPGTVLLVSHDRDFVDRVATSTIGMDGRGRVVETPGGWRDFIEQNPGFLQLDEPAPRKAPQPAAARAKTAPSKLSYKDARRLAELESRLNALPAEINRLETLLADPNLYQRAPARFAEVTAALDAARAELMAIEVEWLELETLRESLAGDGAGAMS